MAPPTPPPLADKIKTPEQFLRLWRNEALRVFHDRLICPEDKELVQGHIAEVVQAQFATLGPHTLQDPILFGDYRWVLGLDLVRVGAWRRVPIFQSPPHVAEPHPVWRLQAGAG